jgi:hypothetical protein
MDREMFVSSREFDVLGLTQQQQQKSALTLQHQSILFRLAFGDV